MSAEDEDSRLFLGVDVGTGSARAALFTEEGARLSTARRKIQTWTNPEFPEGSYEQSTEDVWSVACAVVQVCGGGGGGCGRRVAGVGFTATCSLVAVDSHGLPVTVSPTKDPQRNVILWQDHRAVKEAEFINSLRHPVLRCVGGALSPEMQPPKLLWLQRYLHDDCWKRAGHFFDLADYLSYRATGVPSRSQCCVVCKWTYIGHTPTPSEEAAGLKHGWNDSFWEGAGLGDLVADGYQRIGVDIVAPGTCVGKGLTHKSAQDMGLEAGIAVATPLIDAHCGGVGVLGERWRDDESAAPGHVTSRLALIGGTSTCHMAVSNTPVYVPGVWGPYYSAMLPGYYLSEGGQSTAGQLLDHVLQSNKDLYSKLEESANSRQCTVYEEMERILRTLSLHLPHPSLLTSHLHVVPDFHGNRSPLADPTILGMISGQSMILTEADLAVFYLAVVQSLALGTRHIIEEMNTHGHAIQVIFICGGLRHNMSYVQATADITGLPVVLPSEEESVLLGAGILAAAAARNEQVSVAMRHMSPGESRTIEPTNDTELELFYAKKYRVFREMYKDQRKYKTLME